MSYSIYPKFLFKCEHSICSSTKIIPHFTQCMFTGNSYPNFSHNLKYFLDEVALLQIFAILKEGKT